MAWLAQPINRLILEIPFSHSADGRMDGARERTASRGERSPHLLVDSGVIDLENRGGAVVAMELYPNEIDG
jgi:hypothetical protein